MEKFNVQQYNRALMIQNTLPTAGTRPVGFLNEKAISSDHKLRVMTQGHLQYRIPSKPLHASKKMK